MYMRNTNDPFNGPRWCPLIIIVFVDHKQIIPTYLVFGYNVFDALLICFYIKGFALHK